MREALSEREQRGLMHLRKAQEMEVSIAEYARSFELDAGELYSVRQQLVKKGVLSGRARARRSAPPASAGAGKFVAVRVAPPPATASSPVCRIRHPAGLIIECATWPPGAWVHALMGGGTDAAA